MELSPSSEALMKQFRPLLERYPKGKELPLIVDFYGQQIENTSDLSNHVCDICESMLVASEKWTFNCGKHVTHFKCYAKKVAEENRHYLRLFWDLDGSDDAWTQTERKGPWKQFLCPMCNSTPDSEPIITAPRPDLQGKYTELRYHLPPVINIIDHETGVRIIESSQSPGNKFRPLTVKMKAIIDAGILNDKWRSVDDVYEDIRPTPLSQELDRFAALTGTGARGTDAQ